MRKYLNTLYITVEDAYLSLKGEAVCVTLDDESTRYFPLHTLEEIVCFSYKGASPALMGKCAENNIRLSFFTPSGRYLASTADFCNGNILLRREQFRMADDNETALSVSKDFISSKLYNAKYVLLRCARDHEMQVDTFALREAAKRIHDYIQDVCNASSHDELRGTEGKAAAEYFGVFDELILNRKDEFHFNGRSRRPPTDYVNAMLSFAYTLLGNECAGALISVGLDPYCGFMHTDRPGRKSLSLDLMEELRTVYADRFVLSLINNRRISPADFVKQESGAVIFTNEGKKIFLSEWQKHKKNEITHPFLEEKVPWGLVPYVQALLLSRFVRGDIERYVPFYWK